MGQATMGGRMECLGPIALSLQLRDDGAAEDGDGEDRKEGVRAMNDGAPSPLKCVQNTRHG